MTNPSGAPVSVTISETEFFMSPLTSKDIGELNNYIKQELLSSAKESCKDESNQMIVDAMMRAAMGQIRSVDWISDFKLLQSADKLSYLLWLGVRKNDPKPTREAFTILMLQTWEENFEKGMAALQLVNPFLQKKEEEEEAEARGQA